MRFVVLKVPVFASFAPLRFIRFCSHKVDVTMAQLFLGVDGGGSHTRALLADAAGVVLGRGHAAASNLQALGLPAAVAAIQQAIDAAFAAAGVHKQLPVDAICLGLAGAGRPADRARLEAWLDSQQLARRRVVVSDAEQVLAAGTPHGWGAALISGTGSVCFGRNSQGRTLQVGGWGYLLGDEGSGYDVAVQALHLATQTADGRAEARALLRALLNHWQLASPNELIYHVYRAEFAHSELAGLTRPVVALAEQGDADARGLLDQAADQLARAASSVMRQLGLCEPPLALAGGLLGASPYLRAALAKRLHAGWGPLHYVEEPALGTLVLARRLLEQGGA